MEDKFDAKSYIVDIDHRRTLYRMIYMYDESDYDNYCDGESVGYSLGDSSFQLVVL